LKNLITRLLLWRAAHISSKAFLILASIITGLVAGLAAVALKNFVGFIHHFLTSHFNIEESNIFLFLLPWTGILITTYFVWYFLKGRLIKGVGYVLYKISRGGSNLESEHTYAHIVSSGITVGFGGSAGLESPIVITGSAIGSNIGRLLQLGYRERTLLLACGAAAGIAAIFNSPIAGVLFAVEVLLAEFSIPVFIPLLISAATAAVVSKLLYSGQLFFLVSNEWFVKAIPYYILLGIICGFVSLYMARVTLRVEGFLNNRTRVWPKALLGGAFVGLLIFLLPPLYGEGYETIKQLLAGHYGDIFNHSLFFSFRASPWLIIAFVVVIIFIKVFATAFTTGSGGNGGIFAPSLFTGALTGFALSFGVNNLGITKLVIPNFIVVGMAGILAGVVHAPLTAIFLIAEITGGYVLFVPLMIVSALSFFIVRYFEPYSIYTKKLAASGDLLTNDRDTAVLSNLKVADMIECDFLSISTDTRIEQFIRLFSQSNRNIFPVIDSNGALLGIVRLEDIKEAMFDVVIDKSEKVSAYMKNPSEVVTLDDNMLLVMQKFERSQAWNLPVVNQGTYMGFISKSAVLGQYRNLLKMQNQSLY
jgi:chloride channel protein, CIC family